MLNLIRAEWKKTAGHRWLAGFLIWIFPVGAFVVYLLAVIAAIFSESVVVDFGLADARWTDVTNVWNILSDFPANIITRMPILAFVATLFAGEFEWETWKNILPRNKRSAIILAKFITFGLYVLCSLAVMSLIIGVGNWLGTLIAGLPYGPEATLDTVQKFVGDYTLSAVLAFASTLIVVSFAAFAALITKKIVGGIMIGFLISIIEPNTWLGFLLMGKLFNNPDLINLQIYMPSYSIGNVNSWIRFGHALQMEPLMTATASFEISLLLAGIWVIGLVALVIHFFQRQDVST
jgi:ABC-2 type transport system permease protein